MSKKTFETMTLRTSPGRRPLVLASTSIYRKMLLGRLGLPFSVVAPQVDESALDGEDPAPLALRLAEAKARAGGKQHPEALVIGCDQVAEFEGRAVGKPVDPADAFRQIKAMSGRTVIFHTGLALLDARSGRCQLALVEVESTLRVLSDTAIEFYLEQDKPYDCAASVKAETLGIALFSRIASDDPTALIGLPLIRLTAMLIEEGVDPLLLQAAG
jgi:septum formation protein